MRQFHSILLGSVLRVHTDHKNLAHQLTTFTTQRVLRWRLLLEEFRPTFLYKSGNTNVLADALSRVPTARSERESPPVDHDILKSTPGMDAQLAECLAWYPSGIEFPNQMVDQAVPRKEFPNGQNQMVDQAVPSKNPLTDASLVADQRVQANGQVNQPFTNVNKPLPDQVVSALLLEHPIFDDHSRLPFQFQTLYEYQQEDEHLLALPNELKNTNTKP